MAHLRPAIANNEFSFFANVDFPVGRELKNLTADVQLVQTLLDFNVRLVADSPRAVRDPKGNIIRSVNVDGIFGNQTRSAVIGMQKLSNKGLANGQRVLVDGIIDPINPNRLISTKSKTVYLLVLLNLNFIDITGHPFGPDDTSREPLRSDLLASQRGTGGT